MAWHVLSNKTKEKKQKTKPNLINLKKKKKRIGVVVFLSHTKHWMELDNQYTFAASHPATLLKPIVPAAEEETRTMNTEK